MSNVKHTQRKKQEEKKNKDCCKPLLSNVKHDEEKDVEMNYFRKLSFSDIF